MKKHKQNCKSKNKHYFCLYFADKTSQHMIFLCSILSQNPPWSSSRETWHSKLNSQELTFSEFCSGLAKLKYEGTGPAARKRKNRQTQEKCEKHYEKLRTHRKTWGNNWKTLENLENWRSTKSQLVTGRPNWTKPQGVVIPGSKGLAREGGSSALFEGGQGPKLKKLIVYLFLAPGDLPNRCALKFHATYTYFQNFWQHIYCITYTLFHIYLIVIK